MTVLRTGIDLVEIARLERLNPAIRARFMQRVFSAAEQEIIGQAWQSAAGRFAAKEAVSKALGGGIGEMGWQDIEILQDENNMPTLQLHGVAEEKAAELGLTAWSVSITHSRAYAAAVAVGIGS